MDGFEVIFLTVPLTDSLVSIWMDSSIDVAGVQAETVCTSEWERRSAELTVQGRMLGVYV